MTSQSGSAADRLQAAIAASALPDAVVSAWNAPAPAVAVGQIWRAAWQDAAEIVLITDVGDDGVVTAAPVTVDADFADENTLVLSPEATSLGVELAAWAGLSTEMPAFVLDRLVGEAAEALSAALDKRAGAGSAVLDEVDRRHEYRAQVQDALEVLAGASWAPSGTGTIGTMIKNAGVKSAKVAEALQLRPQEVIAVLRNELAVTPDQAESVAELIGSTAEGVLEANPAPPVDLVARLNEPRRRPQIHSLARRRGLHDEVAARRIVVFETWRQASRQTGTPAAPEWDQRLDQYFAATLDD